jgi:hypothetical protein
VYCMRSQPESSEPPRTFRRSERTDAAFFVCAQGKVGVVVSWQVCSRVAVSACGGGTLLARRRVRARTFGEKSTITKKRSIYVTDIHI